MKLTCKLRRAFLLSLLSVVLILTTLSWVYANSVRILCLDAGVVRADAIVVLGGGAPDRPLRAAELFRAGAAPKVLVSGDGDFNDVLSALVKGGVPQETILLEKNSKTTRQNAEFSAAILREHGIQSAIIVTSWYHSRRALKCFRKVAPDIHFYSRPSYAHLSRKQWARTGTAETIRFEYVKLVGYWFCYGINPF